MCWVGEEVIYTCFRSESRQSILLLPLSLLGEDAWLLGQYVWQFARGFQEGEDQRFTKILSTAKHWAAYEYVVERSWSRPSAVTHVARPALVQP